jgi:GAF domain-containing protein
VQAHTISWGCWACSAPRAITVPGLLTGFASSATGRKGTAMPIDPGTLAKSIGTLTDLDPLGDLPATLQQAVQAAKQLFDADAAGVMLVGTDGALRWASASDQRAQVLEGNQEAFAAGPCMEAFTSSRPAVMHDAKTERRWGEITLTFAAVQIRSGLCVPVDLGGGPIGTLDVYAAEPRGWDQSEVSALQAYAGVVATLLGAAAKAQLKGALAEQLQVALESRLLIERAKGADGTRTPGRPGGLHPPAPGGEVVAPQAQRRGRRGGRRSSPAARAEEAGKGHAGTGRRRGWHRPRGRLRRTLTAEGGRPQGRP